MRRYVKAAKSVEQVNSAKLASALEEAMDAIEQYASNEVESEETWNTLYDDLGVATRACKRFADGI